MTLIEIIKHVASTEKDTFNPDTYLNLNQYSDGIQLNCQYVLGNLFIKGYSDSLSENFEIFKDHGTWQIWQWHFTEQKTERNQMNTPYYNYDTIMLYIQDNIL